MDALPAVDGRVTWLLCTDDADLAQRYAAAVADVCELLVVPMGQAALLQAVAEHRPQALLMDFRLSAELASPGTLVAAARVQWPHMPCVAWGDAQVSACAIAALRAGVQDFVDPAQPAELSLVMARLHAPVRETSASPAPEAARGKLHLVLAARPGCGSSTLAVHLAGLLQQRALGRDQRALRHAVSAEQVLALPAAQRVLLLDIGWPLHDALLYAGQQSGFDFAEAASNLARLDRTLLDAALAVDARGVALLPLPRDPDRMASISAEASLALVMRLTDWFGHVVVDAGGLPNLDFLAALAQRADEVSIVADQGISAVVALQDLLTALQQRQVAPDARFGLLLNRHDAQHGLNAALIAERFGLRLAGTLPRRDAALLQVQAQGQLLPQLAADDPWWQALAQCMNEPASAATGGRWSRWLSARRTKRGPVAVRDTMPRAES